MTNSYYKLVNALLGNSTQPNSKPQFGSLLGSTEFGSLFNPRCAFRRWRPCIPTHGDQLIRSMTTRAAHELDGAVGCRFDFSICGFGQVQVEHFVGFAVARQPPKGGERRRG